MCNLHLGITDLTDVLYFTFQFLAPGSCPSCSFHYFLLAAFHKPHQQLL